GRTRQRQQRRWQQRVNRQIQRQLGRQSGGRGLRLKQQRAVVDVYLAELERASGNAGTVDGKRIEPLAQSHDRAPDGRAADARLTGRVRGLWLINERAARRDGHLDDRVGI